MKIIPWANYIGDLLIVLLLFCLDSPVSYPPYVLKLPIMGRRNTQNTTITNNVKRKLTLSLSFTNHHLLWLEKFNSVSLPSSADFWSLLMTAFLKLIASWIWEQDLCILVPLKLHLDSIISLRVSLFFGPAGSGRCFGALWDLSLALKDWVLAM